MITITLTTNLPDMTVQEIELLLRDAFSEFITRRGPNVESYVAKRYPEWNTTRQHGKVIQVRKRCKAALALHDADVVVSEPVSVAEAKDRLLIAITRSTAYTAGISGESDGSASAQAVLTAIDALIAASQPLIKRIGKGTDETHGVLRDLSVPPAPSVSDVEVMANIVVRDGKVVVEAQPPPATPTIR